jgi:hypothetical protein
VELPLEPWAGPLVHRPRPRDPSPRRRGKLGITERRAYDIVRALADAGYVIKEKDGRRNRYQVQEHLPVPEELVQDRAIGGVLVLLTSENKASP